MNLDSTKITKNIIRNQVNMRPTAEYRCQMKVETKTRGEAGCQENPKGIQLPYEAWCLRTVNTIMVVFVFSAQKWIDVAKWR